MDTAFVPTEDVTCGVNVNRRCSTAHVSDPAIEQPAESLEGPSSILVENVNENPDTLRERGFTIPHDSIISTYEDPNAAVTPPNDIKENATIQISEVPIKQRRESLREISANRGTPMDSTFAALPEPAVKLQYARRRSSHQYVDGVMTPPDDITPEAVLPPGVDDRQDLTAINPALAGFPEMDEFLSPATRLKRQLERTDELIVCPGVYDGFSARIAISVGFDAMYMVLRNVFLFSCSISF